MNDKIDQILRKYEFVNFGLDKFQSLREDLQSLLKQAELRGKLELYKGWLNWVESGGGQVDRTKIRENIAELEAEMGEK